MKKPYKMKLVVPSSIRLAGTVIDVNINDTVSGDDLGMYSPNRDRIVLSDKMSGQTCFRVFCHELSEAIAYLHVNESEKGIDEDVPHTTRDGYGQGIYNFLVENIQNILVVDDGE